MENSILIRRVQRADFGGLVALYEAVWPDVDYNKQSKANFVLNESSGVSYCAECNGRVIGSRTSFFENMYYGNRKLNCVQCGDSCVHPDFQGKGVFQRMNGAFIEGFFKEQPGDLVYNISVSASRRSYEKLGWNYIRSLMKLRKFVCPIRTLFKIRFDIREFRRPLNWDQTTFVSSIDLELLRLRENRFLEKDLLHIRYDAETLEWRMKSDSGIKSFAYSDLGYIYYKRGSRGRLIEVEIGEIFLYHYTTSTFKQLLRAFRKSLKPDIIWVLISEGHPLRPCYSVSGFWANPRQKYLHHGVRAETEEMRGIAYVPMNWAISSLDIDTF